MPQPEPELAAGAGRGQPPAGAVRAADEPPEGVVVGAAGAVRVDGAAGLEAGRAVGPLAGLAGAGAAEAGFAGVGFADTGFAGAGVADAGFAGAGVGETAAGLAGRSALPGPGAPGGAAVAAFAGSGVVIEPGAPEAGDTAGNGLGAPNGGVLPGPGAPTNVGVGPGALAALLVGPGAPTTVVVGPGAPPGRAAAFAGGGVEEPPLGGCGTGALAGSGGTVLINRLLNKDATVFPGYGRHGLSNAWLLDKQGQEQACCSRSAVSDNASGTTLRPAVCSKFP